MIHNIKFNALCYALHQTVYSYIELTPHGMSYGDEASFKQSKNLAQVIDRERAELWAEHDEAMYKTILANNPWYDEKLVSMLTNSSCMADFKLYKDIDGCRRYLDGIIDDLDREHDHTIEIVVDGRTFEFYDHACLVQGLRNLMDEFESEV